MIGIKYANERKRTNANRACKWIEYTNTQPKKKQLSKDTKEMKIQEDA